MVITNFIESGDASVASFTAFVSPRCVAGITKQVWVGQQCIHLHEFQGEITPSGVFYLYGGGLYFRDASPVLARHPDGKNLILVHPAARESGRIPEDWKILEGRIVVEMRGPKHSVLRIGGIVFPKSAVA